MARFVPGRLRPHPESTHPRMHARHVLAAGYSGAIPASCDYYSGISFPVFLNQELGDCTIADVGHAEQVFSTLGQGTTVTVSDQDILTMYERVGGYNPNDPSTDQGCVIQDVLNDWRKNGIGSPAHQILAFLQVNLNNADEVKACCWLFGGCTLGVNLPASAETQFGAGQPWTVDAAADNSILGGHDVRMVGYDAAWVYLVTWGAVQRASWEWLAQWCEEIWAEADGEWIKANASPEGLNVDALNAAFTEVTNGEPGPFPVVGPAPTPTPVPPGPAPQPPAPVVDDVDRALWAAVQPALNHLSHHGAAHVVKQALDAWHAGKGGF